MRIPRPVLALTLTFAALVIPSVARGDDCSGIGTCDTSDPTVHTGTGVLTATYFVAQDGQAFATNSAPEPQRYQWRLLTPCQASDPVLGGCVGGQLTCVQPAGRLVEYEIVQSRRLVLPDHSTIDGQTPPDTAIPGTGFGPWVSVFSGCVDVTALDPAPSPAEVYRYFRTLPLPELTTKQQPPGNALVNLPVIFFTDSPTTQTFTVDIRGFRVAITATASGFTWHTGDGTALTSTDPGAPYPHQTVTHVYRAGSYTASLTATWSATFTVDGGPAQQVPGTTTTDGPPVTFDVLQAHAVLTNPYG
jgi:hypothetical protein